ncbi:MAG: NAD(P)-dependent oxidoreductase [Lachnospiraceae bacterium]|nr:NAD(P)-dependent oxidoreductase [Lachnospiraceae bacterium]
MSKKVGFIGLGNMGRGMCRNLIKAGNDVTVFDTNPKMMEQYRGGAYFAKDTMEVYDKSDFIFLSLPNSNIVEAIVDPFIEKGMKGKILIDTSTSYPPSTIKLAARIKESGGGMIDSPMLAGPEESDSGDLLAVVGGAKEDYEKITEFLEQITKTYRYMGESGKGHLMKIAVNYCSLVQAAMFAQVYPVMKKFGLEEETVYDALNNEIFDNWVFQFYSKRYVSHDYFCGFSLNNGIKDLSYMKRLYEELNVPAFVLDGALDLARMTLKDQTREEPLEFAHMGRTMYQLFGFEN